MAWRNTNNEINVSFTDRDQDYETDSEPWRELANLQTVGGEPLTLNLDRTWFTKRSQAQKAAAHAGRMKSVPWVTSKIVVRKESATRLLPGKFLRLTYADYNTRLIMRVLSRKTSVKHTQQVELELRADGYYGDLLPYTPDRPPESDVPIIEPLSPLALKFLELPHDLAGGRHPHLAPLVARASAMDVGFRVYSTEDGISFDEVAVTDRFAVSGVLATDYPVTTILDDSAEGMVVNLPGPDGAASLETTNVRGWQKQRLLVFVEDEIILRVNGDGAAPVYAPGGDLLVEWDMASWLRHDFWQSWDQPYAEDKLHHRVRLCTDAGSTLIGFRCGAQVSSYTVTNAQLQAAFGGTEPDALRIRVFSRFRGQRSRYMLELRVLKS